VVCGVLIGVDNDGISVEGLASDVNIGFILAFGKVLKLNKFFKGSNTAGNAPGGWKLVLYDLPLGNRLGVTLGLVLDGLVNGGSCGYLGPGGDGLVLDTGGIFLA